MGEDLRGRLLLDLIWLRRPVDLVVSELANFGWDSQVELATLGRPAALAVLDAYIAGEREARDVGAWAAAIEGRDDIGLEADAAWTLKDLVFDLATAELTGRLTPSKAAAWRRRLENS